MAKQVSPEKKKKQDASAMMAAPSLVGGFNPSEKHTSNWIISQLGVKTKTFETIGHVDRTVYLEMH